VSPEQVIRVKAQQLVPGIFEVIDRGALTCAHRFGCGFPAPGADRDGRPIE
jgi:hypothetical protein